MSREDAAADAATDADEATRPRRVGVFGGTFDPVHWGHLWLAEAAREACRLDEVRLVPAASPPHKQGAVITQPRHRLQMLELATAGLPMFTIDRREIGREGPSFTVDTLGELADELSHELNPNGSREPAAELFFLMGADSLADLPTWREPGRIAELATIVAVNRGDQSPAIPAACAHLADRIELVTMPACGLSATDLRQRARAGRSLLFRTPRPVELYIREHELYRGTSDG